MKTRNENEKEIKDRAYVLFNAFLRGANQGNHVIPKDDLPAIYATALSWARREDKANAK